MVSSIHSSSPPTFSFLLQRVLSDPKLLCDFEQFLGQTWCHENLLFIEAMSQLRHEENQRSIELSLQRIYKTFIAIGAPMELNITTQDQVKRKMDSLKWSIIDREEALNTLKETESEVLTMLQAKLSEYIQTQQAIIQGSSQICPNKNQIRICIIGGGFVGFTVASILDAMPIFHVTLIDTKAAFEYTPGIVKKLVNPYQSTSLRVQHDSYVRNGKVIIGYVDEIANDAKSLLVNDTKISFDYMVMATGSSYSSRLKSDDISALYRLTGLEEAYAELLTAKTILIVGGGLVGCELASEISQTKFPGPYPHKKVTIVESNSSVVCRSSLEQQQKATKYLHNLGVEVICNERIIDFDAASTSNTYIGSSGKLYQGYDKVFLTTGTIPNSHLFSMSPNLSACVDTWGRIQVKPTLQIAHWEYQHIFAGGDVTNVTEEKTGYAATLSGVCIARNICRMVKGKEPLKQGKKGTLAAPSKPLHGISSHGGIGKQKLGSFKKAFSFLNPSWAALKYFDEQQFLQLVQGQLLYTTHGVIGRLPRLLTFSSLESSSTPLLRKSSSSQTFAWYDNNDSSRLSSSMSLHSDSTIRSSRSSSSHSQSHSSQGDEIINSQQRPIKTIKDQPQQQQQQQQQQSILDSPYIQQFISDHFPFQHDISNNRIPSPALAVKQNSDKQR
ncbi:uncharacterized protein BX664DRAFT_279352 [Halteromyces radiatus]|uniref:uncharacterized protein n=1 Tax=Halteromyces radiatus TaxID=101107 RepID=UPI00221E4C80|nr:uncharacterized protein BX664DRAFT_279352 [Halteromyces radiatus]KAI8088774.1 hypothetical protein BX664DRAFT_279352 [Halteromyces radiatus]